MTQSMNLVDLFAILPFYLEWAMNHDGENAFAILRMFRMVRVFRILKFGGHVRNLQLFVIGFSEYSDACIV
jgi:hypothetical protein